MKIDVPKIPPEGTAYEGEDPGEILELEQDKFARADGPVTYSFFVQKVAREVVVTGRVTAPLKLLCGRCGDFFSTTLVISSFLRAYEFSEGLAVIDVTADIREDILLELPAFPKCSWEGDGVCPFSGVDVSKLKVPEVPEVDNRWNALDSVLPVAKKSIKSRKN